MIKNYILIQEFPFRELHNYVEYKIIRVIIEIVSKFVFVVQLN